MDFGEPVDEVYEEEIPDPLAITGLVAPFDPTFKAKYTAFNPTKELRAARPIVDIEDVRENALYVPDSPKRVTDPLSVPANPPLRPRAVKIIAYESGGNAHKRARDCTDDPLAVPPSTAKQPIARLQDSIIFSGFKVLDEQVVAQQEKQEKAAAKKAKVDKEALDFRTKARELAVH